MLRTLYIHFDASEWKRINAGDVEKRNFVNFFFHSANFDKIERINGWIYCRASTLIRKMGEVASNTIARNKSFLASMSAKSAYFLWRCLLPVNTENRVKISVRTQCRVMPFKRHLEQFILIYYYIQIYIKNTYERDLFVLFITAKKKTNAWQKLCDKVF